jgi:hypothetical protein
MAEMNGYWDPTLHTEHAAIRHDIGLAEANIRDKVGAAACGLEQSIGGTKYAVATEAAALSRQIGAEACNITQTVGDARQEQAENFGHTRRDVQGAAADIRREVAQGFGTTGDLIMEEGQEGIMATKDARYDLSTRISNGTDRTSDRIMELRGLVGERFYTVGRDLSDLRQGQATLSKDVELNSLKGMLEAQKNTQFLSDKISVDGDKTRALINDLKYHDLNRGLVERNTELVNCEQDRRRHYDRWLDGRFDQNQTQFAGQWAQLQSQIQAFQSQLQETRQGLVNFGTMDRGAGTQSSTSNNVR